MEKAANGLSWGIGIFEIVLSWIICLVYFGMLKESGIEAPWLFAISAAATIVVLILLCLRQSAVNENRDLVFWGVITILFISIPGGILTICLNSTYNYHPRVYVTHKTSYVEEEQKQEEPVPVEEYIFVEPSETNKLEEGSIVRVKESIYVATIGQRVNKGDICEVIEVKETETVIKVNHPNSFFNATVQNDKLLLRIKNPELLSEKESKKKEKKDSGDKFEEIKKYKELLDLNIITQEEFDAKKEELLNN